MRAAAGMLVCLRTFPTSNEAAHAYATAVWILNVAAMPSTFVRSSLGKKRRCWPHNRFF
jgi:hypothetical protein